MKNHNVRFLLALSKVDRSALKDLLPFLSDEGVDTICEALYNVLFSSAGLRLCKARQNELRQSISSLRAKRLLRKLVSANTDVGQRKQLLFSNRRRLHQRGGLIGAILSAAVPLLLSLITRR